MARHSRLRSLARSFALDPVDVELLLVAVAPDIDARFERLYAYLQDDVSRRRASIGLALELCGAPSGAPTARRRLGPMGPLVAGGLVLVEEPERPFLTRSLRVPDRVTAQLLGDDTPEPWVDALCVVPAPVAFEERAVLERALRDGSRLAYLREPIGGQGRPWPPMPLAPLAWRAGDRPAPPGR